MGEEDGDEERFSSVVDTGRWRNIKVCNRLGKKVRRREMGKEGGEERIGEMDDKESNRGDGKRTVMRRKGSKKLDVS